MKTSVIAPHKSSLGLDANILATILYVLAVAGMFIPGYRFFAFIIPLVIFFIEKESSFVKFHAIQATFIALIMLFCYTLFSYLTIYQAFQSLMNFNFSGGGFYNTLKWIMFILLSVVAGFAAYKAFLYTNVYLPITGKVSDAYSQK